MRAVLEFEVKDVEDVLKAIGEEKIPKTKITTKKRRGKSSLRLKVMISLHSQPP